MNHLYFVRHGLSVMNQKGVFSGHSETPLTKKGHEQARAAANELKHVPIDYILCSPLNRTKETAEAIAEVIGFPKNEIVFSNGIIERDFGVLENTAYEPNLGNVKGVEAIDTMIARAQKTLDELAKLPYDTILVVSHGAVGRAMRHCLHPEIPFSPSPGFGNGEVVKLL